MGHSGYRSQGAGRRIGQCHWRQRYGALLGVLNIGVLTIHVKHTVYADDEIRGRSLIVFFILLLKHVFWVLSKGPTNIMYFIEINNSLGRSSNAKVISSLDEVQPPFPLNLTKTLFKIK